MGPLPSSSAVIFFFTIAIAVADAKHYDEVHPMREKTTHLRFYMHEIFDGPNPSLIRVAGTKSTDKSAFTFGDVVVADNPLTEGPELTSKFIGRAQGMYTFASQEDLAVTMSFNYVFVEGKYNGSALTLAGRNLVTDPVREISVVGGTGCFRLARGYALLRNIRFNLTSLVTVEYNFRVIHPSDGSTSPLSPL